MPVQPCRQNGKPGWRFGTHGKCYTYEPGNKAESGQAERRAYIQGSAINHSLKEHGKPTEPLTTKK